MTSRTVGPLAAIVAVAEAGARTTPPPSTLGMLIGAAGIALGLALLGRG